MKIDLVYLWVDGNDPVWREKKSRFLPPEEQQDLQSFSEARFFDNEELRYSLRSVELYAPWVNHIYIVTDNQRPKWLNVDHPKITIVDHTEILPAEVLPTFNSTVIELVVARIKGLSEYYIYANDDMMFNRPVTPDFFVREDGVIRCRFLNQPYKKQKRKPKSSYTAIIRSAIERISEEFGPQTSNLRPHHNIDVYSKSCVLEAMERYSEWLNTTLYSRFRCSSNIHRHIYSLYAVATGRAEVVFVDRGGFKKIRNLFRLWRNLDAFPFTNRELEKAKRKLELYKPALICINDDEKATNKDREQTKIFMNELYPNRCEFERED